MVGFPQGRWRHRPARWFWAACMLALAAPVYVAAPVQAQAPLLRQAYDLPKDNRPLQIFADNIYTWKEGGERVFFLAGKVSLQLDPIKARMQHAIVWVDEAGHSATKIYQLKVVGTEVDLYDGVKSQFAARAVLDMGTRGSVFFKPKVVEENRSESPEYRQALSLVGKAPAAVRPELSTKPGPARSDGAGTTKGLPETELPPPAAPPSGIKLIQAIEPLPTTPPIATPPLPPPPPGPPGLDALPPPLQPMRQLTVRPRSSIEIQAIEKRLPNGEMAVIVTSGVILTVTSVPDKKVLLDIEADQLVFWTTGESADFLNKMKAPSGQTSNSMEFYLSGNVVIRNQLDKDQQELRADRVYYDVGRGVAIAQQADLQIWRPGLKYPIHFTAEELTQLNPKLFVGKRTEVFSSALPSDPGIRVQLEEVTLEQVEVPKRNFLGFPIFDSGTGKAVMEDARIFTGKNSVIRVEGVPVFYLPFISGDIEDPLGPLETANIGYNRIFGFQVTTTWDVFDLFGMTRPPGTRWNVLLDYLSERGPALGTEFDIAGNKLFTIPGNYALRTRAYGVYDRGDDILGGDRGRNIFVAPGLIAPVSHEELRGRWQTRFNMFDMPAGFSVKAQLAAISDQNFLEQFFPNEWLNELNQETFAYVKQQQNNWAWSILAEPRIRHWITETEWLPRADGYLLGQKFFDLFTYNLHASAGYARLRPAERPGFPYSPTDAPVDTGRFDLFQEISLPFQAGPFRVVPYLVGDLTYYTEDLTGDDRGRLYGAAGVRASMPLSRLYPDVCSDIFNLRGLHHKMLFHGNYYLAESDTPFTRFPQLDRLNDDASDQALRDIRPRQFELNPANATLLTTSPIFDPQVYALRRLIDNRIDTRDDMNVIQLGVNQRLQTRRGLPGNEHVIDWMSLDLRGSLFPHQDRDNFGNLVGILEYDWVWNIGDRTALVSSGWFEPFDDGPRVFNFGVHQGRPDNTNLYLGYRQIDPLNSQSVIGSITFPFSAKYALTGSTVYDFGVEQLNHSLIVTRIGTDLMVSLGVNYNSTLNTFGITFEILPVLLPARARPGAGIGAIGMRR